MQYCSLQQWPLLSPSDTYTTGYHFHFGSVLSFFLELLVIALCSSQVAYSILETLWLWWVLIYLWHIFLPFHTVHGFSREEYWSELSFPTPVDHVLGELFTMTHLSWVILHCKAYRLIGLCKSLHHDNTVIYEGLTEEALQIADERREVKRKGERERHIQLNSEFRRKGETWSPSSVNSA